MKSSDAADFGDGTNIRSPSCKLIALVFGRVAVVFVSEFDFGAGGDHVHDSGFWLDSRLNSGFFYTDSAPSLPSAIDGEGIFIGIGGLTLGWWLI